MKQLNVSKKVTAPLMIWVSLMLIAATLLFSFMPLMCLDTAKGSSDINEMIGELGIDADIEMPEKVEISVGKLIGAIRVVGSLIKVAKNATEDMAAEGDNAPVEKIQEIMETDEGKETVLVAAAIATTVMNAFDFGEDSNIISIVANLLIVFVALIYVLAFVFVIPIKVIIMLIKALIPALANLKTPELGAAKVGNKLPHMLGIPFTMMIFQSFIPGMTYGWGLIAISVTIIVSVVFCTVLTRLRTYEPRKFRYLNIVQGASVVSIIGFLVFFFNILKTHVINNFLVGPFTIQVGRIATKQTTDNSYILDFVLIFLFAIAFLSAVKYLSYSANRLSCTVSHKKVAAKRADSKLIAAIAMLIAYVAPAVVSGGERFVAFDGSKLSYLILNDDEKSALTIALIGIIIMIIAEVVLLVLKKKLCKDVAPLEASAIVCGLDNEIPVANPSPVVEEAPVV